jgi:ATP-dependent DNA ligase
MKKCVWVKPEVVAQIEFLEWTDPNHLRHSKFAGLRDDKDARQAEKERLAGERNKISYLVGSVSPLPDIAIFAKQA